VHAASKAFVSFGQALSSELGPTPVTCTTVLPGFTRTNYFSRIGLSVDVPDGHWMTAGQVARISLDAARRGRPLVIPGTRNRYAIAVATQFPSLAKGRAKRRARQAIDLLRGASRRLVHLIRPS
jgi:short-subunit dehydrogenase